LSANSISIAFPSPFFSDAGKTRRRRFVSRFHETTNRDRKSERRNNLGNFIRSVLSRQGERSAVVAAGETRVLTHLLDKDGIPADGIPSAVQFLTIFQPIAIVTRMRSFVRARVRARGMSA